MINSVWESLGIRVAWDHEIVGSNPTTLTENIAVESVLVRAGDC